MSQPVPARGISGEPLHSYIRKSTMLREAHWIRHEGFLPT